MKSISKVIIFETYKERKKKRNKIVDIGMVNVQNDESFTKIRNYE